LGLGVVLLEILGAGQLGDFYNRFGVVDIESFNGFGLWRMLGWHGVIFFMVFMAVNWGFDGCFAWLWLVEMLDFVVGRFNDIA
jgi:hypothetical protein